MKNVPVAKINGSGEAYAASLCNTPGSPSLCRWLRENLTGGASETAGRLQPCPCEVDIDLLAQDVAAFCVEIARKSIRTTLEVVTGEPPSASIATAKASILVDIHDRIRKTVAPSHLCSPLPPPCSGATRARLTLGPIFVNHE